jgi:hypothetical protein
MHDCFDLSLQLLLCSCHTALRWGLPGLAIGSSERLAHTPATLLGDSYIDRYL